MSDCSPASGCSITGVITDAVDRVLGRQARPGAGRDRSCSPGSAGCRLVERIAKRLPEPAPVVELDVTNAEHLDALADRVARARRRPRRRAALDRVRAGELPRRRLPGRAVGGRGHRAARLDVLAQVAGRWRALPLMRPRRRRSSGSTSTRRKAWPVVRLDGRGQGRPGVGHPLPRPRPRARRASGSTWSRPARCAPWRPSRSPASPQFEDAWAERAPLGWDLDRPGAGRAGLRARCCRTGSRPPPARSCTSTAGSTRIGRVVHDAPVAREWTRGVRRVPAAVLRRPGGARRRAAVPGERHARARRAARAAGRGRRALPALRRRVADQRSRTGSCSPRSAEFAGTARPAGLLGQPQLAPAARRHRRGRCATTASPRAGVRHQRVRRRTRRAGSTRRTSPGPGRRSAPGAPELDKLRHFFDHPGFVEPHADAVRAALAALAGRRGRPGWCSPRTPSRRDGRTPAGPRRAAGTRAAAGDGPAGGRGRPRPGAGVRPGLAVAGPGRRRCRGWSRTSTTTWRRSPRQGVTGGGGQPDRLRLRPPRGDLGPRQRGRGDRRRARSRASPGRPPRAPTRGSSRWSASWSRSADRHGSGPGDALGTLPIWDVCPDELLPAATTPIRQRNVSRRA